MKTSYTLTLSEPQATLENVGGKGMSLAKMIGAGLATRRIQSGQTITVDGSQGTVMLG